MTFEQAKQKEAQAVAVFIRRKWAEELYYRYVNSSVRMSRLDGMLVEEHTEGHLEANGLLDSVFLVAGVEVKWRRFDLNTLMTQYNGEMLMPADKLLAGQTLAYAFGVPTLLLYLLNDCLLAQKVVAGNGDKVNVIKEIYELSDRTIEGGTIQRKNCYIKAEGAEEIPLGL
jgi:hypothetical protein|tara:strand:+ start:513 stop:1025 length:513 start_codon:yes stop_codon:yes gene_type:complete